MSIITDIQHKDLEYHNGYYKGCTDTKRRLINKLKEKLNEMDRDRMFELSMILGNKWVDNLCKELKE